MAKARKESSNPINPSLSDATEAFMAAMRKEKRGDGMRIMNQMVIRDIPRISTGLMELDQITDGGYPCGAFTEIFGPESTGKTTMAIHAMVEAQKTGKPVGFIDAEHTFDLQYAISLGLDPAGVVFDQPECAEDALDSMIDMIRSGKFSLVVLDSIAAIVPRAEEEGDSGASHMGLVARLMSQFYRKAMPLIRKTGTAGITTNQIRMKIGVIFGNPETTSGGQAPKFYSSMRIDVRRGGQDKIGDEVVANKIKFYTIKNKTGIPFRRAESRIVFGKGFDIYSEVLDFAERLGIVGKSGSWYSMDVVDASTGDVADTIKLGQGKETVLDLLKSDSDLYKKIYNSVQEALKK